MHWFHKMDILCCSFMLYSRPEEPKAKEVTEWILWLEGDNNEVTEWIHWLAGDNNEITEWIIWLAGDKNQVTEWILWLAVYKNQVTKLILWLAGDKNQVPEWILCLIILRYTIWPWHSKPWMSRSSRGFSTHYHVICLHNNQQNDTQSDRWVEACLWMTLSHWYFLYY